MTMNNSPAFNFQKEVKQKEKASIMESSFSKEMTPDLAEICGIHAGDGCLRKRDSVRRVLCVEGDVEEKEYYDSHVVPLFERTFGVKIKPRVFLPRHTYGFQITNPNVCGVIHSIGFPYGKKTFSVKVPDLILESNNLKVIYGFIRGLFDTDGTLSFRRRKRLRGVSEHSKRHTYPRILLDVCSKDLFLGLCKLLSKTSFNFNTSYQRPQGNHAKKYKLGLVGDYSLLLWMRNIGFKNNVKNNRFLIWDKFGFNPPRLTLKEQTDILSGKIDPNAFYKDSWVYHERKDSILAKNKQALQEMILALDT